MSELALSKPAELTAYLTKATASIKSALPKHLNPDRMIRLATTCWSTTPALRNCTPVSILGSIITASQLGLEPGIAGQGYLVPYKNTCTFVPGWQGLVGLLNNTGRATAWTGAVFEGDTWDFQLGSEPRCYHVPGPNFGDETKLAWVYAVGKVNGSDKPVVEAWPMARVTKHRDKFNKVGSRHYSYAHPEMYARKVVLLQVLKYMPRSVELNNAIAIASAEDTGVATKIEDGVVIELDTQEAPAPAAERKPPTNRQDEAKAKTDPHAELEAFLEEHGFSMNMLQLWGEESGNIENATQYATVQDIPVEIVARLMKAKPGLKTGLELVKGGMGR